jgi:SsrA-binding protein
MVSNQISGGVNKKAYFDYEILETYEAGIELFGFEVKAVKTGRLNLTGSFAVIKDREVWLLNANTPAYQPKNAPADYNPNRSRKLLLHKSEIKELIGKSAQKGLTLVPLKVYTKHSRIKVLLGLAKHKKKTDKRELIKKREAERDIERVIKRG